MRAVKVSAEAETGRMFESDFFEFFSHVHPWQPPLFFVPLVIFSSYQSFDKGIGILGYLGLYLVGLTIWTLMEYWLHRKLFHYKASSRFGKRLMWILHGVHHDWPNDRMRLVFPPTLSLPVAGVVFVLLTLTVGHDHRWAIFAGVGTGYVAYDMIHYWTHHFASRSRIGKFLRKYHLAHHFKDPNTGFGVSSPLWDYVFGTAPRRRSAQPQQPQQSEG